MHDSFLTYARTTIQHTHTAVANLAMYIPYFFSVFRLAKTLFAPWKNITTDRKKPGFSFEVMVGRVGDMFATRFIGFIVRGSFLAAFVVVECLFIIILPVIYIVIVLFLPLSYIFYLVTPSPKQKMQIAYQDFIKRHLTDEKNKDHVIEWFQIYYSNTVQKPWWSLERLMKQPPLGRDLTSGFTNTLDTYSVELTLQSPHHKHLIGRTQEITVIQRILSKSSEANVLLNGETGVGKSAIIEALAKSIYEGTCNPNLAYKRILALDIEKVLATESDFVKREELLTTLFKEAEDAKNIIIVIYNLDRYVSSTPQHIDLTNVFEKFALSKTLQFIATTSPYVYQKFIFSNRKIVELFDKVDIPEVTADQTLRILLDIATDMESRHGVVIVYEALAEAVRLAEQHLAGQPFPEKAIELLDETCVYVKSQKESTAVNAHSVNVVLQQKAHIPTELSDPLREKLLSLEQTLGKRVLFQEQALSTVSASLRKAFVTLGSRKKPLASFLFLGPTGVGKTETAKAITDVFFTSEKKLLRFDMSNYQSRADIPVLIGSSETNEPGQLTEAIRNEQYGTLLLDELEKANKDLLNIFLTIMDEGYFTDGYGKRVDCTHLIVVATSNAGADFIYKALDAGTPPENLSEQLIDHLVTNGIFAPEFLNRFDGVVVYKPLYKEAIQTIAHTALMSLAQDALEKHGIHITISDTFVQQLVDQGYDPRFGARNLRRLIQEHVEDVIAKAVLSGTSKGTEIVL